MHACPTARPQEVTAAGAPSPWVVRFAPLIPGAGPVLDVACGRGRHTRFLLHLGRDVVAVDRDLAGIADLRDDPRLEAVEVDLEDGRPFPLAGRHFAAVVVTNYLHRPILDDLVAAVGPGGLLLYETFASGNEAVGRPSNPAYLLQPGELLDVVARPPQRRGLRGRGRRAARALLSCSASPRSGS